MASGWLRVQGKHVAPFADRGPDGLRVLGEDLGCVDAFELPHPFWHVSTELRREVMDGSVEVVAGEKVERVRNFLAEGAVVVEVPALPGEPLSTNLSTI